MTPERKKYLDGISKEEQTIRDTIVFFKISIAYDKEHVRRESNDLFIALYKESIKESKTVIKALKKQLPQKLVYVSANEDNIHWCLNCPACHYTIVPSNFTMSFFRNYCPCCGQKLR